MNPALPLCLVAGTLALFIQIGRTDWGRVNLPKFKRWRESRADLCVLWFKKEWRPRDTIAPMPPRSQRSAVSEIYTALADSLRGQIAVQSETASSNDLLCVALLAADLALVVALLLLRATKETQITGFWWWSPLPFFVLSGVLLLVPILPPIKAKAFASGPSIPDFLSAISQTPQSLENMLDRLIRDLQQTWEDNDLILARERRFINLGLYLLCVASMVAIGLYAWQLS